MIFAAGLGTRLKPLTDNMPKALVEVGGAPLLKHVAMKLKNAGFSRIVVNVHHFADQIEAYLASNHNFGVDIIISDERKCLLDTGGGLRRAIRLFDTVSPVLIHNVDILSNVDLNKLYASAHADATLLVSQRETSRYLLFAPDGSRRLVGWTNRDTGQVRSPYVGLHTDACEHYAFSGIHVFSPRLYPLLSDMPEKFGIMDFYLDRCADSDIRGYVKPDLELMDVGKIGTISQAEQFLVSHNI